ncbi:MAG: dTDP-D-glucose 4,6-dehydratase [Haloquadratum sp. J07HQX50]|nr:MAG: dTDP-D-glucose 4,6-dehydratase [Haloquadratum sp. J07HQX50]
MELISKTQRFELPDTVDLYQRDLTASPELPEADVIVHLAAHSQVQPIVDEPQRAVDNMNMTQHVLSEATRMDAFVVNASSRDVYGSALQPQEHEVTVESPNGYAASKLGSEALVNAYRNTEYLSAVSLRLANVYGPRDMNRRVIPIFIMRASAGKELIVYGSGKILDFIYIDDVCRAILAAIERSHTLDGEVLNIGSGTGKPLSEVASQIAGDIESCPGWSIRSNRQGDVDRYIADISRAKSVLDFSPTVPFERGLSETSEWYMNNPISYE